MLARFANKELCHTPLNGLKVRDLFRLAGYEQDAHTNPHVRTQGETLLSRVRRTPTALAMERPSAFLGHVRRYRDQHCIAQARICTFRHATDCVHLRV
jgi:hypothetical protein